LVQRFLAEVNRPGGVSTLKSSLADSALDVTSLKSQLHLLKVRLGLCDTFVALPSCTESGSTVFGKNSDREPNEPQVIEYHPRKAHDTTESVRCTRMAIPSVSETYGVLLSRPFWMFGAEMGVNEYGVSIGSEAVFTRMKHGMAGLLGTDILRIALERSNNAKSAVSTITGLLDKYGQGGTNSYFRKLLYDSSFLISDSESAWVLETAGRFWVAKEVHDHYSISNVLTIHDDYDLSSPNLETEAAAEGHWSGHSQRFDFAKVFQDRPYTGFVKGSERLRSTRSAISESSNKFNLDDAKSLLRSHEKAEEGFRKGSLGDVCMHAGGPSSPDQTASSMITTFQDGAPVAYATGSSLPCSSVFKPHVVGGDEFAAYTSAGADFDSSSFWWAIERLHRTTAYYAGKLNEIRFELESEFMESFCDLMKERSGPEAIVEFSRSSYAKELTKVGSIAVPAPHLNRYWKNLNKKARLG
jgi:secernin